MGICYTYLLYDEMDWRYYSYLDNKEKIIEAIKEEFPAATILAQWPHYIVVDMDKNSPYGDNMQRLQKYCDRCYYYNDMASWEINTLQFKQLPEDKAIEDNKPENRNKAHIEQANKEWTDRYYENNR